MSFEGSVAAGVGDDEQEDLRDYCCDRDLPPNPTTNTNESANLVLRPEF